MSNKAKYWEMLSILGISVAITYILQMTDSPIQLLSYISPTIVLMAFSMMIVCLKVGRRIRKNRVIPFMGASTFGVYLLHENNLVRKYFISQRFAWISKLPALQAGLCVIFCAMLIFAVGVLVEKSRIMLFNKIGVYQFVLKSRAKEG